MQGHPRWTGLTMLKPLTRGSWHTWKVLREMGIPDHLTCLLRNLYAGQEATVRTMYGTTDFPIVQMVKNLPAMQETWVQFLGEEDSLEKEMAIHSSILIWKISWIEEFGGLQSMGSQRVRHDSANNWYSRLRKEYNRAVCCHSVCLTHMLSTSWEMPG